MDLQKTGDENIVFDRASIGYTISDFWRWGFSDLLDNTLRGKFSEFIVGTALGLDLSTGFENWLPWDLTFPFQWQDPAGALHDGIRIEVKSSSYLQPYDQKKLSSIVFNIRPTKAWDSVGGYSGEVKRRSDVYVFCVYTVKDRGNADPLVLDGWDFYILPTSKLNAVCGPQKTISLTSLLGLDPIRADYSGIKDAVVSSVQKYHSHFA